MRKILIIFLIAVSSIFSQEIKNWQNYTNMQEVKDISYINGSIWAGTTGGIFSYSETNQSFFKLTKSEGLLSQSITAVSIDSKGEIWFGTSDGFIHVYDPETNTLNTIFDITKTNESNKKVNDIQISGDTAYVSTEFGLILFNVTDLSVFDSILKFGDFNSKTPVKNVLLVDKIYVVTQAGIAFNKEGLNNLAAPEAWANIQPPTNSSINKLATKNSILYAATDKGIYSYSNNIWNSELYQNSIILDFVFVDNIMYSIEGIFDNKLEKWSRSLLHKNSNADEILLTQNTLFSKILISPANQIFIASDNGVIEVGQADTSFIFPNAPATNALISITVDSKGNVWSATGKNNQGIGVLQFDRNNWEVIDRAKIPVFKINDFHKVTSSQNNVYLLSWGRGFVKYNNDNYELFDASNTNIIGIPSANEFLAVNDVVEDDNGNMWIANYWSAERKPLSVITVDNEVFNYEFSSPLFPQEVNVKNMVIDQFNTKWIGGDLSGDVPTGGLFYFNENGTLENTSDDIWGKISETNGLRDNDVKALAIDKFGELIIGTNVGVDVIPDPGNPNSIRGDQYFSIRQQTINCIAIDPINQKWFGTEKGIFLLTSDGSLLLANFTKSNSPLPTDNIKSIAIDKKNGIVYAGTDFGLTAISTLFIEPNEDFSSLYTYPNPVILSKNSVNIVNIDGLIENSEIKILDISGKLVNEFRAIGGKTTIWNCSDSEGKLVSSGIYIVVAYDSEANKIGHTKIAILKN